jgi:hypothetical protein
MHLLSADRWVALFCVVSVRRNMRSDSMLQKRSAL